MGRRVPRILNWSTPVSGDYLSFDGRKISDYGEAVWFTPEGPFTYANFCLEEIQYNCDTFR
jgi:hypothetical protein